MEIMMLMLLYFLAQNPDFPESVKPLMGKLKNLMKLEQEFGVRHLPSDFKKQNGYLRSLQLSEEYGLYRQDYCGCEFSAKARGIE